LGAKGLNARSALTRLAEHEDRTALQRDRIVALASLIGASELGHWPGLIDEPAR
jgi:hypothetical protein